MMTKFKVVGAGMAGLFAAAVLRDECKEVVEAQPEIPNNHAALLRFKSSVVGDALNIPFNPVQVIKAVESIGNPIADAISYSLKTNATARLRSLITAQGVVEERFIAPQDFIPRMVGKVTAPISLNTAWDGTVFDEPVISTLPMPLLARLLGYDMKSEFSHVNGFVLTTHLWHCDLCATIYIPNKNELPYRASITGNRLIVEYAFPTKTSEEAESAMRHIKSNPRGHLKWVLSLFGMNINYIAGDINIKPQKYAKILPIDDNERKKFILWASEQHNIYSLGRFATWRPGLLLDDLLDDIRTIQRLAGGNSSYNSRLK